MPDQIVNATDEDLQTVLNSHVSALSLRLVKSPIQVTAAGVVANECDFPGYAGRVGVFRRRQSSDPLAATTLHCRRDFTLRADGVQQFIAGCFVLCEVPGGPTHQVYIENFRSPVLLDRRFDTCTVSLQLSALNGDSAGGPLGFVFGNSQVISSKGARTMYRLAGQDKALFESALGTLQALLRRDAAIGDLSDRSQRSRVPLVPQEDTELLAAVSLVTQRLALLLETAT